MDHRVRVAMCRAWLRRRSPPRLSLRRTVFPDDAGIGLDSGEAGECGLRAEPAVLRARRLSCREACTIAFIVAVFAVSSASSATSRLESRTASARAIVTAIGSSRTRQRAA